MAKTKSKAKKKKTMEEKKLDALRKIGNQLVELNKILVARFPERDSQGNTFWEDDDDIDGD